MKTHQYGELIGETEHWLIILAPDQRNLGTCVVALKRDEKELSRLKDEEWADFSQLVKKLESAMRKAFNSTHFNWGCLMNSAYQEDPPCPHLHWHFIPRYKNPVEFNGKIFDDPCFGKSTMYNRDPPIKLSSNFKTEIKKHILKYLKLKSGRDDKST
nr:HIT family protein [uncultured Methanobacterium sp.]